MLDVRPLGIEPGAGGEFVYVILTFVVKAGCRLGDDSYL
jgi:hypothetical protein